MDSLSHVAVVALGVWWGIKLIETIGFAEPTGRVLKIVVYGGAIIWAIIQCWGWPAK